MLTWATGAGARLRPAACCEKAKAGAAGSLVWLRPHPTGMRLTGTCWTEKCLFPHLWQARLTATLLRCLWWALCRAGCCLRAAPPCCQTGQKRGAWRAAGWRFRELRACFGATANPRWTAPDLALPDRSGRDNGAPCSSGPRLSGPVWSGRSCSGRSCFGRLPSARQADWKQGWSAAGVCPAWSGRKTWSLRA